MKAKDKKNVPSKEKKKDNCPVVANISTTSLK